jgi:hypothetical protein
MSTYSNLKIELMVTGENSTTWGTVTNTNLGTALEEAITGSVGVAFSSANVTLTLTDTNATQSARNLRLNLTGTATAGYSLILGSGCQINKPYIINNGTDGTITVKNTTGTGIAVPAGKTMWVYNNGTNVVDVVTHLTSLTLGTPLALAQGGTGANTAATARTALGATTVGGNMFTLTNPSAITFPQFNADNTVTALDAAAFRTAIGAGSAVSVSSISFGSTGLTPATATNGAVTVAGTLAIANGGTGGTAAAQAALNLGLGIGSNVTHNSLGIGTTASGTTGEIRATDNVTAYYSSDATLKENVHPIQNALGIVSAVGGKTFDWTDAYIADHGGEDGYFIQKSDFGVIAQHLQAVFPLAVRTREDGTLAVDYEKLVAVAFQAIAELHAEVEALRGAK